MSLDLRDSTPPDVAAIGPETPFPVAMLLRASGGEDIDLEIVSDSEFSARAKGRESRYAIAQFIPTGPGEYRPVAKVKATMIRLSPTLIAKYGFGFSMETVEALVAAGFIIGRRVAPRLYEIDLESYRAHLLRLEKCVAEGTDFWTAENTARYRATRRKEARARRRSID